jgi:general L-amino acid transport system permease protein
MSISFVRDQMLPQQTPPVTQRGAIKWLRENLFSTPVNSVLTIVGLFVVYYFMSKIVPWLWNAQWTATSLGECRERILAQAGEGATGACFAMIRERWNQFIFGLYPIAAYWRPTLAFGLLFIALAPILFSDKRRNVLVIVALVAAYVAILLPLAGAPIWATIAALALVAVLGAVAYVAPARLLLFSIAFPALVFFLLWGGPIWMTLVPVFGFVVLVLAYRLASPFVGVPVGAGVGIVAAVLFWLFLDKPLADALTTAMPWGLPFIPSDEFGGFLLAITIGVTAITFSLPLGILLALGRQSDMFIVKTLSVGFIEFIRGVPLITLLFTAALILGYFLPPGTKFDVILRVMILVTFFAAAYIAEVVRGGLAALPRGQYEAADALGLDYWRAQRLIIMPQALKISIPGIVSTFIGLFKDTTLVSFVALLDPLRGVTAIVRADLNWKGIYWEPYLFVGAIFFVICFGMSRYSMYLEQKLKTDHR